MASLLRPLRFRFTHAADIQEYGDDWHVYNEAEWTALPARELMRYEIEIGIPLVDVMDGVRKSSAFGDLAASWLALKLEGSALRFSDYNPHVMMIEWERVPQDETEPEDVSEGKAPAPESSEGSAPADSPQGNTSPMAPVVLQQLPATD